MDSAPGMIGDIVGKIPSEMWHNINRAIDGVRVPEQSGPRLIISAGMPLDYSLPDKKIEDIREGKYVDLAALLYPHCPILYHGHH